MHISGALALALLPFWARASEDVTSLVQEPTKSLWATVKPRERPPKTAVHSKLMSAMANRDQMRKERLAKLQSERPAVIEEPVEEKPIDTTEFREKVQKVMKYVPFSNMFMPQMKRKSEQQEEDPAPVPLLAAKKTQKRRYQFNKQKPEKPNPKPKPEEEALNEEDEDDKPKKREAKQDKPGMMSKALNMVKETTKSLVNDQLEQARLDAKVSWSDVRKKLNIPGSWKEMMEAEKLPANAPAHLKVIEKKMEKVAMKMMTKKKDEAEDEGAALSDEELEWQSHLYADLVPNATEEVEPSVDSETTEEEDTEEAKVAEETEDADEVVPKGGNAEWRKAQKESLAAKRQFKVGKEFAWPTTTDVKELQWDKLEGQGWCVTKKGDANFARTMSQGTVCRDRCAEDPTCPSYSIQPGPEGKCGYYTDKSPEITADSALAFFPAGAYFSKGSPDGWEGGSCFRKRLPWYWKKHPQDKTRRMFSR